MTAKSNHLLFALLLILLCQPMTLLEANTTPNPSFKNEFCNDDCHSTILDNALEDLVAVSVTRRQYKEGAGNGATATFNSAPLQGSLLVVVAGHRKNIGANTISGSGWTQHIMFNVNSGQTSHRRGMAVWTKIAGPNEPSTITTDFGSDYSKILIQEFSITGGTFTSIDQSASNQGSTTPANSINTGTTPTTTSTNTLVVGAMVGRYSAGSTPNFLSGLHTSVGSNDVGSTYPTMWSAYVHRTTTGAQSSTATYSSNIESSAGIIAYGINPNGSGGGTTSACEIASWDMDEGSGSTISDSESNIPNATINGATWTSRPNGGSALSFDGSNDYINLGNDSDLQTSGDVTIMMWVKPASFSARMNPWSKAYGGEGTITQETNGGLTFYWGSSGANSSPYASLYSSSTLPLNQWTHIAITRELTGSINTVKCYFNGAQVATTTSSQMASTSTLDALIGDGYTSNYNGDIDAVKLFQCAMTPAEISTEMGTSGGSGGSGGCDITVRAKGDCGGEVIQLKVGGTTVASYNLTTSWANYSYSGYSGTQAVSIYFDDSGCNPDPNAYIDYIIVDGTTYQTETVGTHSYPGCANGGEGLWCEGTVDFGVLSCGSGGGSGSSNGFSCEDGVTLDIYGEGTSTSNDITITVPTLSNVNETTIEVAYKNCYPGSTITVSSSIGNITLTEEAYNGNWYSAYVYRATVAGGVTNIHEAGACGLGQSNSGLQSMVVYVERQVNSNVGYSSTFTTIGGYNNLETFSLPIPTSTSTRDITLKIPISEITSDNRFLTVNASSNTGSATGSVTITGPDLTLGSCCFAMPEITIYNVPANSTAIDFEIDTRSISNPGPPAAPGAGQSYAIAGTIFTDYECPCESITTGGTIAADESMCGSYDPELITNTSLPSGGLGSFIEYQWQQRTQTCGGSYGSWTTISGATSPTYNPPTISLTTQYRRRAKREACGNYVNSNTVTKEVVQQYTDAGSIAGTESECGTYNPSLITSISAPTGGCGGTNYTVWQKREYNCTNETYSSWTSISGATNFTYDPPSDITVTTQYRRLSRRSAGCSPGWQYTTPVTKEVVQQYTDAGTIEGTESECGIYNPSLITSISAPTGGCGGTNYTVWQKREYNCADDTYSSWTSIIGANNFTYDPPSDITVTTQYRRLSRRSAGCSPGWQYTTPVTKEVVQQYTNAGTIEGTESECGTYNPSLITSISAPTGGCGGTNYTVWQKREYNCTNDTYSSWTSIIGANNFTYDPPSDITVTTQYRRLSRRSAGCSPGWQYTTPVTKEVVQQYTDAGTIEGTESECGTYNPSLITSISAPTGGCGGTNYTVWQKREYNCANDTYSSWTSIIGANNFTYDPPSDITVTTQYRRLSRRSAGCSPGWQYTTPVTKEVVQQYTDAGVIEGTESKCDTYNPSLITSISAPTGGCGGTNYTVWQKREYNCTDDTYSSWTSIIGANNFTYDPPSDITVTTQYRRLSRRSAGCSPGWKYTTPVTKEVVIETMSGGTIAANEIVCASSFDPALITSTVDPSGGCGGTLEIRWYKWERNCATGAWGSGILIPGATSLTYDPPVITTTTRYRRNTRRASDCTGTNNSWVVSNFTYKTLHENLADGGTISADQENCGGFVPTLLTGTEPTGGCIVQPINYLWQYRIGYGGSWNNIPNSNTQNYQPPTTLVSVQYRRKVSTGSCGDLFSNIVTLTVNEPPTATLDNASFCPSESVVIEPIVCESYPDIIATRELETNGWHNQYNAGGNGLTGDGSLCFDLTDASGQISHQMIGLTTDPFASTHHTTIDYAMYVLPATNNYRVNIYENGTNKGNHYTSSTSYLGSTFCIRRTGTTIDYLLDDTVIYTSLTASTGTLYFDNAFHSSSGQYSKFENIKLCGSASNIAMTYNWSGGGSGATKTVSSTGTYTVTVTDDNGCSTTASSVVTQDPLPDGSVVKGRDLKCSNTFAYGYATQYYPDVPSYLVNTEYKSGGASCGSQYIQTTGASPYSQVANNISGAVSAGSNYEFNFDYKKSGTGIVRARIVWYQSGFSLISSTVITLPNAAGWTNQSITGLAPANAADVQLSFLVYDGATFETDCWEFGPQNGTPTYTESFEITSPYQWSGPNGIAGSSKFIYMTVPGTYTVTVTDPNTGCSNTGSLVINDNTTPPNATATNDGPLTCANTIVNLTANSTTSGVTYQWSNNLGTNATATVSAPGTYTVTVTDPSNGCTSTASTTVLEDITTPTADAGTDQKICASEDIVLTATGGGTYLWSHNAANTDTVTVSPTSTTTYTVTVTASNGCTDTDQVTVNVNEGPTNSGSITGEEFSCGSYDPTPIVENIPASGSVGDTISYTWQHRAFDCNTNQWGSWSDIPGINTKDYDCPTITTSTQYRRLAGQIGCSSWLISNVITKEVIENQTNPGVIAADQSGCDSLDPAEITGSPATGGCQGTLEYQWQYRISGGNWTDIAGATGVNYNPNEITETTEYQRLVKSDPCPFIASNIVTMTIDKASFTAVALGSNLDCESNCTGTIDVVVDHATTGDYMLEYTYSGTTTQVGPFTQDSSTISNLCAGSYSNIKVIATLTNCTDTWSGNISISESHADWEHVTHASNLSDCHANTCDGSFVIDANLGVTGPFNVTYKYNGTLVNLGPFNHAGDITIDSLCEGVYSEITIISIDSGCSDVWPDDIIISTPDLDANITTIIDDSCQLNEGTITLNVSNGVYPYTIEWKNESGTHTGTETLNHHGNITIDSLIGGNKYCFKVTDSNGCVVN